jgi:hypothetical protein
MEHQLLLMRELHLIMSFADSLLTVKVLAEAVSGQPSAQWHLNHC